MDMEQKDLSKTTVKKGSRPMIFVLYWAMRLYYALMGVRIDAVNKWGTLPEAPAIILCNHGSFIDFIFAASLLWRDLPHFVVARLYFYHRLLGWALRKIGCFPKSMFAFDAESTKNCLRVLKNGERLAMMPEARLSTVGRFEDIQASTYSFLKKAGVGVYTVKLHGDYFADPKWGKGVRRGSVIQAELDILFTPEQLRELSVEEIQKGVEERLYYDEFCWLETQPNIRYRSRRLAEGLENILTLCPVCGAHCTVTTRGCDIMCTSCGTKTILDERYQLAPGFGFENFGQWFHWQKEQMRQKILQDEKFTLTSQVELRLPGDGWSLTRHAGTGVCTLNREGLCYCGTRDGRPYEVRFSIQRIYRLLFGAGENFEIYNGTEILYFVPAVKQSSVDWYIASMLLNDMAREESLFLTE